MTRGVRLWLAVAAIVVGVVLAYRSAAISSRSSDDAPAYSIRRHDPFGTAAIVDLLKERGVAVKTLERPTLDENDHGVLIQVLPAVPSKWHSYHLRTSQLADWMAKGNTVIQFTRGGTELMSRFKLTSATQPAVKELQPVEEAEAGGSLPDLMPGEAYLAKLESGGATTNPAANLNGRRLMLRSPVAFDDSKAARWRPLATLPTRKDAVVAGEMRIGQGKLVVVGAPTPALNGTIGDEANLDFLLAEIGKGPVILDEWSHGVGHEATIVGFVHDVGLLPVLVQVAFIAVLYVWSTSGHRPRADNEIPRQRSSIEQIETLGYLYSRSLPEDVTFDRVSAEIQRRLCDGLRCTPAELKKRLGQLSPELSGKIQKIYSRLSEIEPEQRVRCKRCGYDLTLNKSGRCPECGADIPVELQNKIAATEPHYPNPAPRRERRSSVFADALTMSHQLARRSNVSDVQSADLQRASTALAGIRTELAKVILGQEAVVEQILITLMCGGHGLLEGVPGVAKTLTIRALAATLSCRVKRIQFTPDLMPSDITGTNVFDLSTGQFRMHQGPIFTDLLLADEINRAPAKTQTALLEAMSEKHSTIDGVRHELSPIFTVFATQNPIEFEGTYPLPEAQQDRFLLKIAVPYPSAEAERTLLDRVHAGQPPDRLEAGTVAPVLTVEELRQLRDALPQIRVEPAVIDYIMKIVRATREHESVLVGASPRGSIFLLISAKARALLQGRDYVTPDDVAAMLNPVLGHRMTLTAEAEIAGESRADVLRSITDKIEVPR